MLAIYRHHHVGLADGHMIHTVSTDEGDFTVTWVDIGLVVWC